MIFRCFIAGKHPLAEESGVLPVTCSSAQSLSAEACLSLRNKTREIDVLG